MPLASCTDLIASKGTKFYIGPQIPENFDFSASSYAGLEYTEVGMIESIGEFGPNYNIGSYTPIGTGVACKYMGSADYGEISLTIAKTTTDSGLQALLAHVGNVKSRAFRITLNNAGSGQNASGTNYYFPGLTKSATVNIGTGDDVVRVNVTVVPVREFIETSPT